MKSFKQNLSEAAGKNTHMTHIEDLILDGGVKGARQAILALRSLRDMLSGSAKSAVELIQEMASSLLLKKVYLMQILKYINHMLILMLILQVIYLQN